MTEIKFSDTLSIWKTSFNLSDKDETLRLCYNLLNTTMEEWQGCLYEYLANFKIPIADYNNYEINNSLDSIMKIGTDASLSLIKEDYDFIQSYIWLLKINKVNPAQPALNDSWRYHNHVDTNAALGYPPPLFTFVSYLQVPSNLKEEEGNLILKDVDNKTYTTLPSEGDIIIFKGDIDHGVLPAPNANLDRIVLAGSIGVEKNKII